jgi:hypothetical protein
MSSAALAMGIQEVEVVESAGNEKMIGIFIALL